MDVTGILKAYEILKSHGFKILTQDDRVLDTETDKVLEVPRINESVSNESLYRKETEITVANPIEGIGRSVSHSARNLQANNDDRGPTLVDDREPRQNDDGEPLSRSNMGTSVLQGNIEAQSNFLNLLRTQGQTTTRRNEDAIQELLPRSFAQAVMG